MYYDGAKCPCGGGGWVLSSDVWVACPLHEGVHPEWEDAYNGAPDGAVPALPSLPEAPVWEDDGIPF